MQTRSSTGARPSIHNPDRSRQDESLSSSPSFIQYESDPSNYSKITDDDSDPLIDFDDSNSPNMPRHRQKHNHTPKAFRQGTPLPLYPSLVDEKIVANGFNRKPWIWGLLVCIVVANLWLVWITRSSGPSAKEECRISFKRLKEDHPEQDEQLIRSLFVSAKRLNEDSVSSIVLMYTNRTSSSAFVQDVISSSVSCTKSGQSHPIILQRNNFTREMEQDQGRILTTFGEQLKRENIMLVEDLDQLPESVAIAFHTICDQYTPWAKPAIILFTMEVPETTDMEHLDGTAMDILKKQWAQLPRNVLDPLVVRITDQVLFIK